SGSIAVNECCNGVGDPTGASSAATPYGSGAAQITLPGSVTGVVLQVKVTLSLTFNFPQDLDVLLVGPGNRTVMLMSDTGGDCNGIGPDQTITSWSLDITNGPATAVRVKTFTARRVWSGIALT